MKRGFTISLFALALLSFFMPLISNNQFTEIIKLISILSLAVVLIVGTGVAIYGNNDNLIKIIVPGPIILSFFGIIQWFAPQKWVSLILLMGLFVFVVYRFIIKNLPHQNKRLPVIVLMLLVILLAFGKATYTEGPKGELFGGTVSRSLEVGDRSDSRISYHTVQIVANQLDPHKTDYFGKFGFAARGPLGGLIASPFVILHSKKVPIEMPDQPYVPFDDQGFAVYRLVMIVLASLLIPSVYGLLKRLTDERYALMGTLMTAITPFIVHETYFTWPKLIAVSFVLLSLLLAYEKKIYLSGIAYIVGYLFHPLVIPMFPFFGMWLIIMYRKDRLLLSGLKFIAGFVALYIPWYLYNIGSNNQIVFLEYIAMSDGFKNLPLLGWLEFRFMSLYNTLVPLSLFFMDSKHVAVNEVGGQSSSLIHFYMQYWTTLPFGLGILLWGWMMPKAIRFIGKHPIPWIVLCIAPLTAFWMYWGAAATGLLREGLHLWFVGLIFLFCWSCYKENVQIIVIKPWFVMLMLIDVTMMMLLPSFQHGPIISKSFPLVDVFALAMISIGVIGIYCFSHMMRNSVVSIAPKDFKKSST